MEHGNEFNGSLIAYLPKLRRHFKLALLSNSSSEYLRNILADNDLAKYFDEIVISSEVGLIKPEPAAFHYILNKLALNPAECVFVDDNPNHVASAEKVGVIALTYTTVDQLKLDLSNLTALNHL